MCIILAQDVITVPLNAPVNDHPLPRSTIKLLQSALELPHGTSAEDTLRTSYL